MKFVLTATFLIFLSTFVAGQSCTTPGQTPSTAFPVCGTSTFLQNTVPICVTHSLKVPGCSGTTSANYQDKNPYWYKFTCYQAGTLGFLISPIDQGDDYDWQLYDITGHNPDDVFTDASLIVTGNWAGTFGNTGASNAGVNFIQCASDPADKKNSFAKMPTLIQGHTYLLLVSHFTESQSGYKLSFGGGTAVITDTTRPKLKSAEAGCGGDVIRLKLNKKMKCSSIAANGSDFYVMPGNVPVISAVGINCSNGFDTDSVELRSNSILGPGNYDLQIKKGSDANTVLDYCDNGIPETDKVNFTVYPLLPTPMDSITPLKCGPQSLRLVFRKPMLCSTIAADGSDFAVSGTYPVNITSAAGSCTGGSTTSKEIIVNLSQPLYRAGSFTLTLRAGSDGNTIRDECNQATPAGSTLAFTVLNDTVNADFNFQIDYGCSFDTVNLSHPGANNVDSWKWNLDENKSSTQQNPQALYKNFDTKKVSLIVSNGFCSDTSSQTFPLDNFLKADFDTYADVCPNEANQFTSLAEGQITGYSWDFGDGSNSAQKSPSHIYAGPNATTPYIVKYTVTDKFGCESTAQKTIRVYSSCYLAVPNAFTPNGDGKNDLLYPLNAIKADKLLFKVYNRWGQLIFETNNWKQGWNGTHKGIQQPSGVYVWLLSYVDRDSKQPRQMKGTAALIR
jgi:gliding motility-associated-like protein